MTEKLQGLKAKAEREADPQAREEALENYHEELGRYAMELLGEMEKDDAIYAMTEWLEANASARSARALYQLIRATKIYLPATFPVTEFDCEIDDVQDDEWQSVIDEADRRLNQESDPIKSFQELVWDTIHDVLEEQSPDWYLSD